MTPDRDPRLATFGLAFEVPNNLDEAIDTIQAFVESEVKVVDEHEPDPLAPIGEQIAHTLRRARTKADSEILLELHKTRNALSQNQR